MKKLKKIIAFVSFICLLTSCKNNEFSLNKEVTLTGKITVREITKDNETFNINILNLNEPIVIEGTKINKIELDYDKDLKNDKDISVKGIIKNNNDSNIDLTYSFKVSDVDDILSYINTFSNEDFSMTIPVDIIKNCGIEKIDKGFAIYTSNEKSSQNEVFKIIVLPNEEFKSLNTDETKSIEKVKSNKEKTVLIVFNNESNMESNPENFDLIIKNINNIKDTIQLK